MFKNNKIKKFLAFSILSSGVLFCGTSASGVVKRSSSFGGFDSKKVQPSVRRALSLGDLVETSSGGFTSPYKVIGTGRKLEPFLDFEDPGIFSGIYRIEIKFDGGTPSIVFVGNVRGNPDVEFDQDYIQRIFYFQRAIENHDYLEEQFGRVTKDNNS